MSFSILDHNYKEKIKSFENFFDDSFNNKIILNTKDSINDICSNCELRFKCLPCPFQFNKTSDYYECYYVDEMLKKDFKLESINSPIKLIIEKYNIEVIINEFKIILKRKYFYYKKCIIIDTTPLGEYIFGLEQSDCMCNGCTIKYVDNQGKLFKCNPEKQAYNSLKENNSNQ